jgi:hypothetical protein
MYPQALHRNTGDDRSMGTAQKYQRFAEECMRLARTAKDAQVKALLLHMAQVWVRLAENQTADSETEDASVDRFD